MLPRIPVIYEAYEIYVIRFYLFNVEFDKSPASLPKKVKKCNMNLKLNYRNTFLSDFRIHIRIFCIDKSISLNHQF